MKLLLIAPPSAHRNEVSAFLAQRGAEVEVRSIADPSALQGPGAVDAVVVLEGDGRRGDDAGRWPPDMPVIRWSRGGGSAGAGPGARPAPPFAAGRRLTPSVSGLQELAFRVAQAAHGTVPPADVSPGGARRSYRLRAGSAGPDRSATPAPLRSAS